MKVSPNPKMTPHTVEQYIEAGCGLFNKIVIGLGVHMLTSGMMCDGCGMRQTCKAFNKLYGKQKPRVVERPTETVREMATRLGVSISEVRRMRRQQAEGSEWN